MGLVTTPAIVLSALKYGEADLIIKALTQKEGVKSYLLRGVLKSRKGKLRAAMFQPLTQLEIEAFHKNQGTLERIKEARLLQPYRTLHTHVVKSAIGLFLSEILRSAIQEEEKNDDLFNYLIATFNWLDTHDHTANFHLLFLVKLTRYLGFQPDDSTLDLPYFNLLEGTFEHAQVHIHCIMGQKIDTLKTLLGTSFDDLEAIKLNQKQRTDFLKMILQYYELHLQGFKQPRSLSVLNSIFN